MPPTETISKRNTIATITDGAAKKVSVSTLADRPNSVSRYGDGGLSAGELKARFDALPELNRKKINEIIEALASDEAASYITLGDFLGVDNLSDFLDRFTSSEISSYILAEYARETDRHEKEYDLNAIIADLNSRVGRDSSKLTELEAEVSGYSGRISAAEDAVSEFGDTMSAFGERVADIEAYLGGDNFILDESAEYIKCVPKGACEKAKIVKIGGMTHLIGPDAGNLFPYPYSEVVSNWEETLPEQNGVVTIDNYNTRDDKEVYVYTSAIKLSAGVYILDLGNDYFEDVYFNTGLNPYNTSSTYIEGGKWRINASAEWTFSGISVEIGGRQLQSIYPMLYKESEPITWGERGMSEKLPAKVTELRSIGRNLAFSRGWSANNVPNDEALLFKSNSYGTTLSGTSGEVIAVSQANYSNSTKYHYSNGYFCFVLQEHLEVGAKYRLSFDITIKSNPLSETAITSLLNGSINLTKPTLPAVGTKQRLSLTFTYSLASNSANAHYIEFRCSGMSFEFGNVMITRKDVTDVTYTPAAIYDSFVIPETVQSLDGYGESNTAIERTDDGRWLFRDEYKETDVTDLMPESNLFKVQGGGTITVLNSLSKSVPTSIKYLVYYPKGETL